jgi:hypothetical protein
VWHRRRTTGGRRLRVPRDGGIPVARARRIAASGRASLLLGDPARAQPQARPGQRRRSEAWPEAAMRRARATPPSRGTHSRRPPVVRRQCRPPRALQPTPRPNCRVAPHVGSRGTARGRVMSSRSHAHAITSLAVIASRTRWLVHAEMNRPPAEELRLARVAAAGDLRRHGPDGLRVPRHLHLAFSRRRGSSSCGRSGTPTRRPRPAGFGMPLTDLAISYIAPARYDDLLSVQVGVAEMSVRAAAPRLSRHRRAWRPRRSARRR